MSNRRPAVLRLVLVLTALGACSEDTMSAFPEEDASDLDAPAFDAPATDTGSDAGTDRGAGTDTPARDRGPAAETSICPASCGESAECDPCRAPDTPSTVQYCCISGLCVSMTGTCPAFTDGGPGDAMGSDAMEGGTDGSGGDAPDLDDADEEDTGAPPSDAGEPSDLGRGDAATGDAARDATTDTVDAAAMDAADAADAADGRD